MKSIISYSLFGNEDYYMECAAETVKRFPLFYPDWEMRIYYAEDIPEKTKKIIKKPSYTNTIEMPPSKKLTGACWRFRAIDEPNSIVHIRDIDEPPTAKDVVLINYWIMQTDTNAYITDPGVWEGKRIIANSIGFRGGLKTPIIPRLDKWLEISNGNYGHDEAFLDENILPEMKDSLTIFDNGTTGIKIPYYLPEDNTIHRKQEYRKRSLAERITHRPGCNTRGKRQGIYQ